MMKLDYEKIYKQNIDAVRKYFEKLYHPSQRTMINWQKFEIFYTYIKCQHPEIFKNANHYLDPIFEKIDNGL